MTLRAGRFDSSDLIVNITTLERQEGTKPHMDGGIGLFLRNCHGIS